MRRVSALLLALYAGSAQDRRPARPPSPATESLRFSIASRVATTCGSVFSPSVIRGYVDARVRRAGITVSSVHTSQLAAETDCVPRGPRAGDSGIAVEQCLGYSELVSAPAPKTGVGLANTWRKCQSFVCASGRCESSMRAGLNVLMNSFFADFEKTRAASALTVRPIEVHAPASAQNTGATIRATAAFYFLYILACIILLLYWQFRSSMTSLRHP